MTMQNSPTTANIESDSKIQSDSQHGVLGSWWQLAIGMTEASYNFGFGLAQDTRAELRRRADGTLTFAEEMTAGSFKYVHKLIERVDRLTAESLGRSEAALFVMTRTLRKTGHGVTDLASSALSDTIGSSPNPRRNDGARAATA